MKDIGKRKEAQRIAEQASRRRMNPLEATAALNAVMEGLTGSVWNPGHNEFKIWGANGIDAKIYLNGLDSGRMAELAALCYHQAQINGSLDPGEVHICHGISSKHYRPGFDRYLDGILTKYSIAVGSA